MRLIDADKLEKLYKGWLPQLILPEDEKDKQAIETCIAVLEDAPTIDPESLRPTAEWKDLYGGKFDNPRYACSNCEGKALYTMVYDLLGNSKAVQVLSDSCPHCGAKMKGGAE